MTYREVPPDLLHEIGKLNLKASDREGPKASYDWREMSEQHFDVHLARSENEIVKASRKSSGMPPYDPVVKWNNVLGVVKPNEVDEQSS